MPPSQRRTGLTPAPGAQPDEVEQQRQRDLDEQQQLDEQQRQRDAQRDQSEPGEQTTPLPYDQAPGGPLAQDAPPPASAAVDPNAPLLAQPQQIDLRSLAQQQQQQQPTERAAKPGARYQVLSRVGNYNAGDEITAEALRGVDVRRLLDLGVLVEVEGSSSERSERDEDR